MRHELYHFPNFFFLSVTYLNTFLIGFGTSDIPSVQQWRCEQLPIVSYLSKQESLDSADLESTSGPARSATCSTHTQQQCRAQVASPPPPPPPLDCRHPLVSKLSPARYQRCEPPAQGCFLSGLGSKTADSGKVTKCTGGLTFSPETKHTKRAWLLTAEM